MAKFALVGCSQCDNLWIVRTKHESIVCSRCGAGFNLDEREFIAAADDKADVIDARSQRLKARVESENGL